MTFLLKSPVLVKPGWLWTCPIKSFSCMALCAAVAGEHAFTKKERHSCRCHIYAPHSWTKSSLPDGTECVCCHPGTINPSEIQIGSVLGHLALSISSRFTSTKIQMLTFRALKRCSLGTGYLHHTVSLTSTHLRFPVCAVTLLARTDALQAFCPHFGLSAHLTVVCRRQSRSGRVGT